MDPGHTQLLITQMLFFVCVSIAFKLVVDAIVRFRILKSGVSETLLAELLIEDAKRRRSSALRWGIFLVSIGLGFAVLELIGSDKPTPGSIAVIAIAAGIGQLAYHRVSRTEI
jgi:hypothetical protein